MAKKIEITGSIEQVVRMNEKNEAKMVMLIPVSAAGTIPMGKVSIIIEPIQSDMFEDEDAPGGKHKPVRGDRG